MGCSQNLILSGLLVLWMGSVGGIGVNWGTQATHTLEPATIVAMLKDNGFQKVKLFEAEPSILRALSNSGLEVMVGIPNDMLTTLAASYKPAEDWVADYVSSYNAVDIRYVAVGNEPFLPALNGSFIGTIFPALENIQAALTKAGLNERVKVTIPLNADVYQSSYGLPSDGNFCPDLLDLMLRIAKLLDDNSSPFTINIYPSISLYNDPNFPPPYAFFNGYSSPLDDGGGRLYDNVLDANHDTLVWALSRNGYPNISIVIEEVGWPTDGDRNANAEYAQQFNQGLVSRVASGKGTPMRPGAMKAFLFSLLDEDAKSMQSGNFERHWGLFYLDGTPKYDLHMGTNELTPAKGVKYLASKWCVFSESASLEDEQVTPSVSYACQNADCSSLGYGTSCSNLNVVGNISYAFNSYYQQNNQLDTACKFPNLSIITDKDPSQGDCKFRIMIQSLRPIANVGGRFGATICVMLLPVFMFMFTLP